MDESNQSIVPSGHFSQWVADNVDHNIATIDGHNQCFFQTIFSGGALQRFGGAHKYNIIYIKIKDNDILVTCQLILVLLDTVLLK